MEDNSTKDKEYTKLIHHFDSLQHTYTDKSNNEYDTESKNFPFFTKYVGLQKGKIYDVKYENSQIKLFVKTKYDTYTFKLNSCDKYNENVEFIKFIEYYNININYPSELIDKEILLKKDAQNWNIYFPNKISVSNKIKNYVDIFLRFFGYHNLNSYKYKSEIITALFVLLSISITFSTILFYIIQEMTASNIHMNIFVYLILIFPFIASVSVRLKKI